MTKPIIGVVGGTGQLGQELALRGRWPVIVYGVDGAGIRISGPEKLPSRTLTPLSAVVEVQPEDS